MITLYTKVPLVQTQSCPSGGGTWPTTSPKTNGENTRQLISIEEMTKMIELAETILHKAIMIILAKTGVRKGELLAMDLDDLNLEKGTIIIKPKAKRTNRLAFIDDEALLVINEYLKWREPRARCIKTKNVPQIQGN